MLENADGNGKRSAKHIDEPRRDTRGRGADPQVSDRGLEVPRHVVPGRTGPLPLSAMPDTSRAEAVPHQDPCNPGRLGVLTVSEDPTWFLTDLRGMPNSRATRSGPPVRTGGNAGVIPGIRSATRPVIRSARAARFLERSAHTSRTSIILRASG